MILVGLPACTLQVPIPAGSGSFTVKPIAAEVGHFIAADTAGYVHSENVRGSSFVFPVGEASLPRLKAAFDAAFQASRPVESLPPYESGRVRPVAVIEARIDSFFASIPVLKTQTYRAEIVYAFTLYDPEGAVVANWRVEGTGVKAGQIGLVFARWPGEAAALALDDAVEKLVQGLRDVPEIRRWEESLEGQQSPSARLTAEINPRG